MGKDGSWELGAEAKAGEGALRAEVQQVRSSQVLDLS